MTRLDPRLRGFAAEMRNAPTTPEARLWSRLRASQTGFKFRRQAVIGSVIVDFFCPAIGLVVELDGRTHNGEADTERDARLQKMGFAPIRFTNAEVASDLDAVVNAVHVIACGMPSRFSVLSPIAAHDGEGAS